ncbi:protein BREAKING OF ASYMMETRY IN THE STOMATAL LINEAGE [Telopea speciosissima]|uniref:protein BREAKING OF ASYMMETRY IN THE STOMATAL LINEAGE n=1 Tax=Telopea speciosissima TaxID=54955 RepID=UPI001CC4CE45|nr:protein BREAKING OF ASYMMETRY IN THE STOMATAL LINEAGE [Telopea speciosissima]
MCTPWTIARLTRWRIGEWASCLFACKLPSDDESDTFHPSVPPHVPSESRLSGAKQDETRIYVIKPGTPSTHKSNKQRLVPISIPSIKDSEQLNSKICSQYYPPEFKEEDYIVFCFKEDGTFEVVKDEKSESCHHVNYRTELSKAVINRKTVYGDNTDTDSKYGDEDVSNEDGIDFDVTHEESYIFADEEEGEDEEESIYFDSEAPPPGIIRAEAHDADDSGTNSQESSFSTTTQSQSSSSTGSFAFPVLRCEWNGSPIKMPKPEALHLRKLKPLRIIGLQCCKF